MSAPLHWVIWSFGRLGSRQDQITVQKRGYSRFVPGESQAQISEWIRTKHLLISNLSKRATFAPFGPACRICHHGVRMPSPIGHTLAALAIRWAGRPSNREPDTAPGDRLLGPLSLACVAVAVLPDVHLLFYARHRT